MSKHSMRRGSAGSAEHVLQRLERVVLRRRRLVEPRLVRERGVAVREIDEAALLAALRHDDPHAPAGALGQPASRAPRARRAPTAGGSRAARRAARRTAGSPPRSTSPSRDPTIAVLGAQLDALDDAAAAHLEDLDRRRRPGRASAPNTSRWPSSARRHLLLAIVQRLHRAHRVAQLRRLLEALAARPRRASAPRSVSISSSFLPFEKQLRQSATARAVLLRRADRRRRTARCSA